MSGAERRASLLLDGFPGGDFLRLALRRNQYPPALTITAGERLRERRGAPDAQAGQTHAGRYEMLLDAKRPLLYAIKEKPRRSGA